MQKYDTKADETILFNFKWARWRIQQMHQLSRHRGTTASAIIKELLIQQFKADGIDVTSQGGNIPSLSL